MPSPKRRTTSSFGSSQKSTKKEPSRQKKNLSVTSTPLLELDGNPPNREKQKLAQQLAVAKITLEANEKLPEPRLAIYRTRHVQRLARLRKHVRNLKEALADTD